MRRQRTSLVAGLSALGLLAAMTVLVSRPVSGQVQGSLPAFVRIQTESPGTAQTGHSSISGTGIFGTSVGIGTQSVTDPLTVEAAGYGIVHRSGGTELGTYADGTGGWLGTRSPHPFFFFAANGPARLTVDTSGYIGIGTTAPTSTLDVNGTATLGGLLVPAGAGSGKVLTSDDFGNATWQNPGGFALPYAGSSAVPGAGVFEVTNGADGPGWALRGHSSSTTGGQGIGVYGSAVSGYGLWGETTDPVAAYSSGVWGQSASTVNGRGVTGYASATSGTAYGVLGQSDSTHGAGIFGYAPFSATTGTTSAGVLGRSDAQYGTGVLGEGTSYGVMGRGIGKSTGVYGYIDEGETWFPGAIMGQFSTDGSGNAFMGIGRVVATGTKSFLIDHPLDPANAVLLHYCTESPEPLNSYRGTVRTDARGFATVDLPKYFDAINADPTVQLTVVDGGEEFVLVKLVRRPQNGTFTIRSSRPAVEVDWRVEARRNDAYVRKFGAPVEVEKTGLDRGRYLMPGLYGQPLEKSLAPVPAPIATRQSVRQGP
ncbi:MAG: hypothetical protein JST30_13245 [Armatimonadetes bacterium]|nr:hypothetical protein [Armatimonadota bacterium]